MSLEQDVAAARAAVDEVERASARVIGHYREGTDVRRLRADVARLREDLDLLSGTAPAAVSGPRFASSAWDDGMDLGAPGRTTR